VKKAVKIGLRILAGILCLVLLLFIGGWIYLKKHKKEVISFIESEARKGLNGGEIHIGDINIGFSHTFPRIAFTIDTLSLRDSLWHVHHHDLVSVTRAYATLDFFKMITGKISIGRVQLEAPHIYLFTDTNGYTNTSVFKKKEQTTAKTVKKNPDYPDLDIRSGVLVVDQKDKGKFFGFDIKNLFCQINGNTDDPGLNIKVNLNCRVQRLTFNQEKGSYLEGKTVAGNFALQFNTASKVLQFAKINLLVDQQPFVFSGKFFLAEAPTPFVLSWETENLSFRKAASFLASNIRLKLDHYDISETITKLVGSLDNSEPEYKTPLIHLRLNVNNKTIVTPIVIIDNASFTATFNNEEIKGLGHEDENTVMHFSPFNAKWNNIEISCDSIVIRNLIHPRMNLHIKSEFNLQNINNLLDESTMAFNGGTGRIDFVYNGSLETDYDSLRMVNGNFQLDSGKLLYLPRNLQLENVKGNVRFEKKDMFIENMSLNTGNTDLLLNGSVKSLFYLINQRNNKLALDWSIRSNKLNLNDFISYLRKKETKRIIKKKKPLLAETLTEISNLIENANIHLDLQAKQLVYKRFYADNLVANLELDDDAINLKSLKLQQGAGTISVQGALRNEIASNPFSFVAQLRKINVSKIFTGFNNFGLKTLTDKNIAGVLSADVKLNGGVTTKAQIIPEETKGTVKFSLVDGQLIDFDAVKKISQTIFKNRNFSDIQFAELHDVLDVNGENITINRMEIHSSVLTMFVEGIYNTQSGPDLSIQVPLSNLKASKDSVQTNKGVNSKTGVSARLRAQRGDDGKVKISWDPFNKAGKAVKKSKNKT
jgi:hypothetical protein